MFRLWSRLSERDWFHDHELIAELRVFPSLLPYE
jgi:hypothetical protein